MSRARILADYVSSGDELADKLSLSGGAMTGAITTNSTFDGIDVATRDAIHAPKANPAFTGTPTGITAAHLEAGVLPSDVTGGSGLTALGTVITANLSNTAIVYPAGHVIQTNNAVLTGTGASVSHTTGWTDTGLATSLTLIQANAKVLMQFSMCIDMYNIDSSAMCQCEDSIAGASYVEIMDSQAYIRNEDISGSQWHEEYATCTGFIKTLSNSAGDSYAIKVRVYGSAGTVYTHYNTGRTSRRSHFTIQELAL